VHLKKYHPGDEHEPGVIYNVQLILGYIEGGTPGHRVKKYALDFVAERAIELGMVAEWGDLCGRQTRGLSCICDGQDD
jgi:hypothetical protein